MLGVTSQKSERSCICVLGATRQESERPCICMLGVPRQDNERSCKCVLGVSNLPLTIFFLHWILELFRQTDNFCFSFF